MKKLILTLATITTFTTANASENITCNGAGRDQLTKVNPESHLIFNIDWNNNTVTKARRDGSGNTVVYEISSKENSEFNKSKLGSINAQKQMYGETYIAYIKFASSGKPMNWGTASVNDGHIKIFAEGYCL